MIVGGAAQLAVAPVAAVAEKRLDPRLLIPLGYGLFAAGLFANAGAAVDTDFAGLVLPQVLRGCGVMLCLLPTTRVALDGRHGDDLTDASALFNLMRNLGGAIGIAAIDTIVERRVPVHAGAMAARLLTGDATVAPLLGLSVEVLRARMLDPLDNETKEVASRLVERAAYALSFDEAWMFLGALFAASLCVLPLLRRPAPTPRRHDGQLA
jgi:MFS transporter, DHA2 family, multidrug resistance protein